MQDHPGPVLNTRRLYAGLSLHALMIDLWLIWRWYKHHQLSQSSSSPHSQKKSSSSTSASITGVVNAVPSGCLSKMTSAKLGFCFSKTLNFRLICALLLSILVEIIVKSLPYSFKSRTKVLISLGVQIAAFLGVLAMCFSLRLWVCWSAISSMTVEMVETDSMLELTCEWQSSTVLQKTLPALP